MFSPPIQISSLKCQRFGITINTSLTALLSIQTEVVMRLDWRTAHCNVTVKPYMHVTQEQRAPLRSALFPGPKPFLFG